MGKVTEEHRQLVLTRDDFSCVSFRLLPQDRCWGHLDMGHLIGRGMGGGDRFDTPGWIITQCRGHNDLMEHSSKHARAGLLAGHKIAGRNWTPSALPERALVLYPDGKWYYLNDDGTREERRDDNSGNDKPLWRGSHTLPLAPAVQPLWLRDAAQQEN